LLTEKKLHHLLWSGLGVATAFEESGEVTGHILVELPLYGNGTFKLWCKIKFKQVHLLTHNDGQLSLRQAHEIVFMKLLNQ
jgi:hypothetical protein